MELHANVPDMFPVDSLEERVGLDLADTTGAHPVVDVTAQPGHTNRLTYLKCLKMS